MISYLRWDGGGGFGNPKIYLTCGEGRSQWVARTAKVNPSHPMATPLHKLKKNFTSEDSRMASAVLNNIHVS